MQGTAADIIKRAMLKVDDWLNREGDGISMIMQVHDELVFEVPEDRIGDARRHISHAMMTAAELAVPLEVGIGVGANWDEAH
jgi:DNA polymerase-1